MNQQVIPLAITAIWQIGDVLLWTHAGHSYRYQITSIDYYSLENDIIYYGNSSQDGGPAEPNIYVFQSWLLEYGAYKEEDYPPLNGTSTWLPLIGMVMMLGVVMLMMRGMTGMFKEEKK